MVVAEKLLPTVRRQREDAGIGMWKISFRYKIRRLRLGEDEMRSWKRVCSGASVWKGAAGTGRSIR